MRRWSGGLMESLRYTAVYWKTLDGLQLLGSLVLDSITCPDIETVEEEEKEEERIPWQI